MDFDWISVFQSHDLGDILHQCCSGGGVGFRAVIISSLFIYASLSLAMLTVRCPIIQATFHFLRSKHEPTSDTGASLFHLNNPAFSYEARLYPASADDREHCLPEL